MHVFFFFFYFIYTHIYNSHSRLSFGLRMPNFSVIFVQSSAVCPSMAQNPEKKVWWEHSKFDEGFIHLFKFSCECVFSLQSRGTSKQHHEEVNCVLTTTRPVGTFYLHTGLWSFCRLFFLFLVFWQCSEEQNVCVILFLRGQICRVIQNTFSSC